MAKKGDSNSRFLEGNQWNLGYVGNKLLFDCSSHLSQNGSTSNHEIAFDTYPSKHYNSLEFIQLSHPQKPIK